MVNRSLCHQRHDFRIFSWSGHTTIQDAWLNKSRDLFSQASWIVVCPLQENVRKATLVWHALNNIFSKTELTFSWNIIVKYPKISSKRHTRYDIFVVTVNWIWYWFYFWWFYSRSHVMNTTWFFDWNLLGNGNRHG